MSLFAAIGWTITALSFTAGGVGSVLMFIGGVNIIDAKGAAKVYYRRMNKAGVIMASSGGLLFVLFALSAFLIKVWSLWMAGPMLLLL